eukprot:TRINITY_DN11720_c0_g3_i1.p1 TRINITY_DN11720_c0_g3~~TRINITY_DN11720_c0_g3_i1.p1  ORF type:complete len:261 (+),score=1.06 TRINITY_DN11720_c0_g3_i1:352-1134(+)
MIFNEQFYYLQLVLQWRHKFQNLEEGGALKSLFMIPNSFKYVPKIGNIQPIHILYLYQILSDWETKQLLLNSDLEQILAVLGSFSQKLNVGEQPTYANYKNFIIYQFHQQKLQQNLFYYNQVIIVNNVRFFDVINVSCTPVNLLECTRLLQPLGHAEGKNNQSYHLIRPTNTNQYITHCLLAPPHFQTLEMPILSRDCQLFLNYLVFIINYQKQILCFYAVGFYNSAELSIVCYYLQLFLHKVIQEKKLFLYVCFFIHLQ